jgi:Fic family protein
MLINTLPLLEAQASSEIENIVTTADKLFRHLQADAGVAERQAASRYLKALASIGVLREQTFGRERLFMHPKLMTLLTREGNDFDPYS